MESILKQLKQRQIIKVATIYAISAWPLIQIADLAVPALGLPDTVMVLLLKIFIIGFPISLAIAWIVNFTSEGMMSASEDYREQDTLKANFKTTVAVTGSLIIALIVTILSQLFIEPDITEQGITQNSTISGDANTPLSHKRSIAILPFVPFSKDPNDEFFVDGMVEELLNLLAKIPDLQVVARTSSFLYKGTRDKNIVQIGQELGVDVILEGSFRKNDVTNRIRITAQLIDVSTGNHIWSETYDREYLDIFQIQDDIANSVLNKLVDTLAINKVDYKLVAGTHDIDAMVEYGKGQTELAHRTVPTLEKALQHFENAITSDENYANAYIGLADATYLLALYGNSANDIAKKNAEDAIASALKIDPNLGAAYASQGLIQTSSENDLAEESFKKAIELSPNYAMAYMWYGSLKRDQGNATLAKVLFEKAFALDPKSPVAAYNVAWSHYLEGNEDIAMDLFSTIIANDPYYPGAFNLVANILSNRGRIDEAIGMYLKTLQIDPLNKNAVIGLLLSNMDISDFDSTNKWFSYSDKNSSILSEGDKVIMRVRNFMVQGQFEQANKLISEFSFTDGMMNIGVIMHAEKSLYEEDFDKTISLYESLRSAENKQGNFFTIGEGDAVLHLAFAYQRNNQPNKAIELLSEFEKSLQNGVSKKANSPDYYYNMAAIRALQGNETETLNYFQGAIDAGWVQAWKAEIEPIFAQLTSNQRFKQMIGGVNARLTSMKIKKHDKYKETLADL